jgi:hypothetical protein
MIEIKKYLVLFLVLLTGVSFVFAAFNFNNGVSDDDSTSFDTSGGAPACYWNVTDARWAFSNGDVYLVVVNSSTPQNLVKEQGCFQSNGIPTSTCCPQGYSCNQTSGKCIVPEVVSYSCSDYINQVECEGANLANVKDSIYQVFLANLDEDQSISPNQVPDITELSFCDPNGDPQTFTLGEDDFIFGGCGCVWEDNVCSASYDSQKVDDEPQNVVQYTCSTKLNPSMDMCDEQDQYVVSWTAQRKDSNGNVVPQTADCKDGQATFPCPEITSLPFFSFMNLMLSLISVFFVYLIFGKKFN